MSLAVLSLLLLARLTTAAQCSLCGIVNALADTTVDDPNKGDDVTCSLLINALNGIDDGTLDCDNLQLAGFQTGCCGSNLDIPSHTCTVCPDATTLPYPDIGIPGSQGRRDLTCGELASEPSFFDYFTEVGDCRDTFLQRSAAWCKCPGVEIECTLCPDGKRPPNPEWMENVLYGWTCSSFEFVTALLSHQECPMASELFEFDAAAFCCPNDVAPPGVCSFCPSGQQVANPNRVISTTYGSLTCGEIDESLSLIPTEVSCNFARERFSDQECCVASSVVGSVAGITSSAPSNRRDLIRPLLLLSAESLFLILVS
jgi:hypothetical protein